MWEVIFFTATICNDFVRRLPGVHALRIQELHSLVCVDFNRTRLREALLLTELESLGVTMTVESKRVSLKGMYVWGVNSTVTKHSDYFVDSEYFVGNDTSERVAQRYDDTIVKKRVNWGVLKHLFGGIWATKKIAKNKPENALPDALLMSHFQNFEADAARKKKAPRSFNKWINSR